MSKEQPLPEYVVLIDNSTQRDARWMHLLDHMSGVPVDIRNARSTTTLGFNWVTRAHPEASIVVIGEAFAPNLDEAAALRELLYNLEEYGVPERHIIMAGVATTPEEVECLVRDVIVKDLEACEA